MPLGIFWGGICAGRSSRSSATSTLFHLQLDFVFNRLASQPVIPCVIRVLHLVFFPFKAAAGGFFIEVPNTKHHVIFKLCHDSSISAIIEAGML